MTDEERNKMFDDKKRRVCIELTGIDPLSKEAKAREAIAADVEVRVTDSMWGKSNAVSWMDRTRITDPMNNDIEGFNRYDPSASDHRTMIGPDWYKDIKLAEH